MTPDHSYSRRALLELVAVLALSIADLWWLQLLPWLVPAVLARLTVIAIVVSSIIRRRRDRRPENAPTVGRGRAWLEAAVCTAIVAILMVICGLFVRTEPYDELRLFAFGWSQADQAKLIFVGLVRASIQQVILLGFLAPVSMEIFRRESRANLFGATIFGAAHLPNPILAGGTFVVGWMWIWLFRRGRSVGAVLASHLVLVGCAYALFPERTLNDLHFGAKAIVRAPQYEVYERPEMQDILRRACRSAGDEATASTDAEDARSLLQEILGRPPTAEDMDKWAYRSQRLSRCSAAKKAAMWAAEHP